MDRTPAKKWWCSLLPEASTAKPELIARMVLIYACNQQGRQLILFTQMPMRQMIICYSWPCWGYSKSYIGSIVSAHYAIFPQQMLCHKFDSGLHYVLVICHRKSYYTYYLLFCLSLSSLSLSRFLNELQFQCVSAFVPSTQVAHLKLLL